MKISITYKNGKLEEFNFERFTTSEVFKEKGLGNNICSDFILRTDYDLSERGLFLDIHWYDTLIDKQTKKENLDGTNIEICHAGREIGRRIALVSPDEIKNDIYEITVDDSPLMWNDNGEIINGRLFSLQENQLVKDKENKCLIEKAHEIFNSLKEQYPFDTDESICKLFGYTPTAYTRVCHALNIDSPFDPNPLAEENQCLSETIEIEAETESDEWAITENDDTDEEE